MIKKKIEIVAGMREIGNYVADTTLLEAIFGDIPRTRVKEGLRKTVDWLKDQS